MSQSRLIDEMLEDLHELIEVESNSRNGLSVWVLIRWSTDQVQSVEDLRDLSDPLWKKTLRILNRNLVYQWSLVNFDNSDSEEIRSRAEKAKKRLLNDLKNLAKLAGGY